MSSIGMDLREIIKPIFILASITTLLYFPSESIIQDHSASFNI